MLQNNIFDRLLSIITFDTLKHASTLRERALSDTLSV